ncbi:MAG TPA: ATP-dependent helicase C-terminal domain-containing protein [Vicinamibacterales bacterium]|nr:ATP-dependent helicase C-terminal domain-containing protein [Vicinamibacterales bacterium]
MTELPIDAFLPEIGSALDRARAVVVVAQPGAGKTTRVPPALVRDGRVILLQPRRVATRAVVKRIADECGWTIGREAGWHTRFERRFGPDTQLLAATEGILTSRLQQDPLLSDFRTIVLDEFHERTLYGDVAIALAKQAWLARADLRIVVMSATIDAGAVAAYLGGCPVVNVPGSLFPVDVSYHPGRSIADAAIDALTGTTGSVLAFLPGMMEIRRAVAEIRDRSGRADLDVLPLHGSLDADEQDAALGPPQPGRRRVIVCTNVAETSVTVPGVTAVVDSGLHKVARYDAERAIDSLETERVTQDAADQRAGRAGRTAPGRVFRLWDARHRLRAHREADIHRVDLSATMLDVLDWGGDPRTLDWFEAPGAHAVDAAMALLERLGAIDQGHLTEIGRRLQRLPLHPRLGRILLAAGGARPLARACALLSERHYLPARSKATSSDLLSALDDWSSVPPHVQRVARDIEDAASDGHAPPSISDDQFRRAILAGYPDRVAMRREPGSDRVKLATGTGAIVSAESGVREGRFLVAVDVQASTRVDQPEHRVRIASRVEAEWLEPTSVETVHRFDASSGTVRAARVERYDEITLRETPASVNPESAGELLAKAWLAADMPEVDRQFERRLRFAGHSIDLSEAAHRASMGARSLSDVRLANGIDGATLRALEREAPEQLPVPSGRTAALEYRDDGSVMATVKLQELFGLADTPRIGRRREPVLLALTAPNGRPVQMTRDLRSFWERTYPEVRKELRGRYPRHPWPEDPWNAVPTHRAKSRRS